MHEVRAGKVISLRARGRRRARRVAPAPRRCAKLIVGQPGHRARRDHRDAKSGGQAMTRRRCCRSRLELRVRRDRRRSPHWAQRPRSSGTARPRSRTSTPSSSPEALRTATTSGRARSPRFSPVMTALAASPNDGGPVLGICNGFQVLTEAGLLPGALRRNDGLRFLCTDVVLEVERDEFGPHRGTRDRHEAAVADQPLRGQLHLHDRRGRACSPTARSC